jgi:hypothetical protein
VRASDRHKTVQEDAMQTRKETREDKLRDEESLDSAAQKFAQVATEILTETIGAKRGLQHPVRLVQQPSRPGRPEGDAQVRTPREGDRRAEADRCAEEATLHYEQVDGR